MPIACVVPREEITHRLPGLWRLALSEEKPHLMKAFGVAFTGTVGFCPHKVADRPESAVFPGRHEQIYPWPPIKGGEEAVRLEHPVQLSEGRLHPGRAVVVRASPAVPGRVVDQVRGVGDDEVDAFVRKLQQKSGAVGAKHLVCECRYWFQIASFQRQGPPERQVPRLIVLRKENGGCGTVRFRDHPENCVLGRLIPGE